MTRIHDGGTDWWGPGSIRSGSIDQAIGDAPCTGCTPKTAPSGPRSGATGRAHHRHRVPGRGEHQHRVIDAQRRARDAETGVAIAEHVLRRARLELLVATGQFPR